MMEGGNQHWWQWDLWPFPTLSTLDVDECHLYQSSPQTQICLHDCLNLPGSYRCLCPPGYVLHADRNACEGRNPECRAVSLP